MEKLPPLKYKVTLRKSWLTLLFVGFTQIESSFFQEDTWNIGKNEHFHSFCFIWYFSWFFQNPNMCILTVFLTCYYSWFHIRLPQVPNCLISLTPMYFIAVNTSFLFQLMHLVIISTKITVHVIVTHLAFKVHMWIMIHHVPYFECVCLAILIIVSFSIHGMKKKLFQAVQARLRYRWGVCAITV